MNATYTQTRTADAGGDLHPLRMRGPKYPAHDGNAPIFEGIDLAGLALATVITLGPLAAYAFGLGG